MWIFTKQGFFSAVSNSRDDAGETVTVRARVMDDVQDLLRALDWEHAASVGIIETPHADYRYRVVVPRKVWAQYLVKCVDELTYTNVKDSLDKDDPLRHRAMMGCWRSMGALQPGGPYGGGYESDEGAWRPAIEEPYALVEASSETGFCSACDWYHAPGKCSETD